MIEINLLPEELKARVREKTPVTGTDLKRFLFILPVIAALLLCLHIYLAAMNIKNGVELRSLTKKWEAVAPQKKELDEFNKSYAVFSDDIKAAERLTADRVDWSQKLDRLSRDLPAGIWFRDIFIKSGSFTLEGSVLSLQEDEMGLIKEFMDALKNDAEFFKGFESLDLGSVQRKALGSYNVIDFVLTGKTKAQ